MAMSKAAWAKLEAGMQAIGFSPYRTETYFANIKDEKIRKATLRIRKLIYIWRYESSSTEMRTRIDYDTLFNIPSGDSAQDRLDFFVNLVNASVYFRVINENSGMLGEDSISFAKTLAKNGTLELLAQDNSKVSRIVLDDSWLEIYGNNESKEIVIPVKPRDISELFVTMGEFYGRRESEINQWADSVMDSYR